MILSSQFKNNNIEINKKTHQVCGYEGDETIEEENNIVKIKIFKLTIKRH